MQPVRSVEQADEQGARDGGGRRRGAPQGCRAQQVRALLLALQEPRAQLQDRRAPARHRQDQVRRSSRPTTSTATTTIATSTKSTLSIAAGFGRHGRRRERTRTTHGAATSQRSSVALAAAVQEATQQSAERVDVACRRLAATRRRSLEHSRHEPSGQHLHAKEQEAVEQ